MDYEGYRFTCVPDRWVDNSVPCPCGHGTDRAALDSTRKAAEAAASFQSVVAALWDLGSRGEHAEDDIREAVIAVSLGGPEASLYAVIRKYASPDTAGALYASCLRAARQYRAGEQEK
jgi:hypothetical protein